MSNPVTQGKGVVTQIRQNLRDTLNSVSVGGGYSIDLRADVPTLDGSPRIHGKATVQTTGVDWMNGPDAAHGCDEGNWNFDIFVQLVIPESLELEPDELIEAVADDLRTKILEDTQRGGNAIYTELSGWRPREDGEHGCIISGLCYFQTPYRSPRE